MNRSLPKVLRKCEMHLPTTVSMAFPFRGPSISNFSPEELGGRLFGPLEGTDVFFGIVCSNLGMNRNDPGRRNLEVPSLSGLFRPAP